jgi:trehalose 6-phosphate phosphatase
MRDLLANGNRGVLNRFVSSAMLLGFDFDGTLAPIVDDPDAARMRARTRQLLQRVCLLYPAVVISGRSVADVRGRLKGVGLLEVIGNHGLEPWRSADEFARQVAAWLPVLHKRLGALKGVVIEDKRFSVAVHFRKSREKRVARLAIEKVVAELQPLRVIGGHQVMNLLPDGAPHKGVALGTARERFNCDTALYVGDDETDEDVFARDEPGRLLTVRIGRKASSHADYFLESQQDIDALLGQLVQLRARPAVRTAAAL